MYENFHFAYFLDIIDEYIIDHKLSKGWFLFIFFALLGYCIWEQSMYVCSKVSTKYVSTVIS